MAWTNWGFDGTINEAQWAQMAGLLGNGYVAAGNGDCLVTAVGGARSVSVAAGTLYGDGVVSVNSAPETVAMTTPVNGQWYVIALRRTWATNTAALVAIAGATTSTTTPTAPPTSFPTLNTSVGVLTDQPIAWAWCNSANTTVVVYDIRLKAVKSLPPVVANSTERDAKFMAPTQGLQVWRDDLGMTQTYYGLYNVSTNPGGRDVAGWYSDERQNGLVTIKPGTITAVSGTATMTSLGKISFGAVSKISFDNAFVGYDNYKVFVKIATATAGANILYFRYRASGAEVVGTTYFQGGLIGWHNATSGTWSVQGGGVFSLCPINNSSNWAQATLEVSPGIDGQFPKITAQGGGESSSTNITGGVTWSGINTTAGAKDGFAVFPDGGTITGYIQIFGYNTK